MKFLDSVTPEVARQIAANAVLRFSPTANAFRFEITCAFTGFEMVVSQWFKVEGRAYTSRKNGKLKLRYTWEGK